MQPPALPMENDTSFRPLCRAGKDIEVVAAHVQQHAVGVAALFQQPRRCAPAAAFARGNGGKIFAGWCKFYRTHRQTFAASKHLTDFGGHRFEFGAARVFQRNTFSLGGNDDGQCGCKKGLVKHGVFFLLRGGCA